MPKASPIIYAYNAGELSPLMAGRVDQAKYRNGCAEMEGFLPTVQGPAIRRGGSYFVSEVKDSSKRTWLAKFQFNVTQAYILEFGDLYIRFYTSHAQVLSGMAAYEVVSPYTESDMIDTDGVFKLKLRQRGDTIYIAHPSYPPMKLIRLGNTNWTLTEIEFVGGPFKDQNIDKAITVYASAETGTGITLTASSSIFEAAHVGSLFYLEQKQIDIITQWEVGKSITSGNRRRSDGKTYEALNTATTGSIRPIHTEGAVYDGDTGVQWDFRDAGYGWVKITGYTSGTVVTADVISRLPSGCVSSGNASHRWAHGAWSDVEGYPSYVTFFRNRLTWFKNLTQYSSVSEDYENMQAQLFGEVTADAAIVTPIEAEYNDSIVWAAAGNELLVGTAGDEVAVGELATSDPLGPANIRSKPQTNYGSRSVPPERVGDSLVYTMRSGKRVRDIGYNFDTNAYRGRELTVLADHIAKGQIISMAYQQEPYSILWAVRNDGKLIAFTYNQEQDVTGWHRHPIGPRNHGYVECVVSIPAPDNSRDEVWMIVKRTINGATKRYIEYFKAELEQGQRLDDAFYMDSGLSLYNNINATLTPGTGATTKATTGVTFTAGSSVFSSGDVGKQIHYDYVTYDDDNNPTLKKAVAQITGFSSGTVVTCTINSPFPSTALIAANGWRLTFITITGLGHLEGETVDILLDGATHPQKVVTAGAVTLDRQGSVAHVGEPCPAKIKTMRIEAGSADGTAQGKIKRIIKVVTRFFMTVGGKIGPTADDMEDILFRDASAIMDEPVPLYDGDKDSLMPGGYDSDGYITIVQDQPLPMTVLCFMPRVMTEDG